MRRGCWQGAKHVRPSPGGSECSRRASPVQGRPALARWERPHRGHRLLLLLGQARASLRHSAHTTTKQKQMFGDAPPPEKRAMWGKARRAARQGSRARQSTTVGRKSTRRPPRTNRRAKWMVSARRIVDDGPPTITAHHHGRLTRCACSTDAPRSSLPASQPASQQRGGITRAVDGRGQAEHWLGHRTHPSRAHARCPSRSERQGSRAPCASRVAPPRSLQAAASLLSGPSSGLPATGATGAAAF